MVATWFTVDCGSKLSVVAASWRGTSSRMTVLARWAAHRLLLGSGGAAWWFCVVELSCATVLVSHSNRLLFESSSRGVIWSC